MFRRTRRLRSTKAAAQARQRGIGAGRGTASRLEGLRAGNAVGEFGPLGWRAERIEGDGGEGGGGGERGSCGTR